MSLTKPVFDVSSSKFRAVISFSSILLTALILSCSSLQNMMSKYAPDISLANTDIAGIDFEGVDMLFTYQLKNNVNYSTTMNNLKFDLTADDKLVTSVDSPQNVEIPALGTTTFDIKHRIKYTDFAENIMGLFNKDSFNAKVKGTVGVFISQTIGSVNIPISASKVVEIPKIPAVKFDSFNFKSQNLASLNPSATFDLNLKVNNKNSFLANIAALNYNFSAAGMNVAQGAAQNISLPAGQETSLSIPVTVKGKELINMLPKLRDFSNNGGYNLNGAIDVGNNIKIPYSLP